MTPLDVFGGVMYVLFFAPFRTCDWSNCGQGAVAIFIVAPVWLLFAVITALAAWAAARKLARTPTSDPPRSVP